MNKYDSLELNVIKAQMKEYCAFSLGEYLLLNSEPSFDKLVIKRDNQRMQEALECTYKYGAMPFYGIKDIYDLLEATKKGQVITAVDCLQVVNHIRGVSSIKSYYNEVENKKEQLLELTDSLIIHGALKKLLEKCFDDYGEVLDNATPELSSIRRNLKKIDDEINSVTAKFVQTHASSLVDSIVTTRNNRVVVLAKISDKNTLGGMVYGESASGQAAYVEPQAFVSVNNRKQELLISEQDEIQKILRMCSLEIGKNSDEMEGNLETIALLDCLFAKAEWGKNQDAIVATVAEDASLYLKKARHPLIDRNKVVSNTYQLKDPYRVLLITGPNTGGKTVSLKVIGLSIIMTYCGMPITCDEASIPFYDDVFVDIGDDQSVMANLSTFSAHLSKLADVSNHATSKSLALLDEIGSGTDPKEGESLAIAILNYLRDLKCNVVATTHYGRLKTYGKRHEDILLASVQFDLEHLIPTYKFIEGLTGQSNAFEVARKYGLNEKIIKNAQFLKSQAKSSEDELIDKLEKQLIENEQLKEQLNLEVTEQKRLNEELLKEKKILIQEKQKNLEKAKEDADKYLEEVKQEADSILDEIRSRSENAKYHEVLDIKKQLKELSGEEDEDEPEEDETFHEGDFVTLKQSNQVCRILRIVKNNVTLEMNGITIKSKLDKIRHTDKVIKKPVPIKSSVDARIASTMNMECNLIGMHVEDALEELSSYLDDARLHRLKSVRIIHGDGTGALRKAVHTFLKNDKDVVEYRLGMPNEGSTGATIVTLRG